MFKNRNPQKKITEKRRKYITEFMNKFLYSIRELREKKKEYNNMIFSFDSSNYLNILVYFKRKNVKVLCEIWSFNVVILNTNHYNNFNLLLNRINKKLKIFQRTIIFLLRYLPLYSLLTNRSFKFNFEIEINQQNPESLISTSSPNVNIALFTKSQSKHTLKFHPIEDIYASVSLELSYINLNEVFSIEEELKQNEIKKEIEKRKREIKKSQMSQTFTPESYSPPEEYIRAINSDSDDNTDDGNYNNLTSSIFNSELDKTNSFENKNNSDLLAVEKNAVRKLKNQFALLNKINFDNEKEIENNEDDLMLNDDDFINVNTSSRNKSNVNESSCQNELHLFEESDDEEQKNDLIISNRDNTNVHIDDIAYKLSQIKKSNLKQPMMINTKSMQLKLK